MKIMLVCDSMGIGGAETHVLCLARELCRRGHGVVVLGRYGALVQRLLSECEGRASFVSLSPDTHSPIRMAAYVARLSRLIKREAPDVVHAHSRATAFAVGVVRKMGRRAYAFVVTAHAMYQKGRLSGVFSVWGEECIAVSEDIKNHLSFNFGVPTEKITVIPNGIDTDEFSPRKPREARSILFASRLDSDSSLGAVCLCRAAKRLKLKYPDVKIRIAGGGDDRDRLMSERDSEQVVFLGQRDSLASDMANASVVIGVSRVALEGMASEKNVILFGNEGALGLLDRKKLEMAEATNYTCRGCGVKDENFLFTEIDRLFSMNDDERESAAADNRRVVLERHSQKKVVDSTLSVYERTLNPPVRIALLGYYGFGNMGDETLLSSLLAWLSDNTATRVCVLNKRKRKAGGVRFISRRSLPSIVSELLRADVFILGGGSLLQNETSTRSLLYYCFLILLSRLLGCRCVLLSNGLGPLATPFARWISSLAIKAADRVSLRDRGSLSFARELGREGATLCADLCFLMRNEKEESDRIRRIKSRGGYMLVSLKGDKRAEKSRVIGQIERVCRNRGLRAVFLAMDEKKDGELARECAELCGGEAAFGLTVGEVLSLLSDARYVVGERLHFLIFALSVGRGFVGVGDAPKIRSFLDETLGIETLSLYDDGALEDLLTEADRFSSAELLSVWEANQRRVSAELFALDRQFLRGRAKCSYKSIEKRKEFCYNDARGVAANHNISPRALEEYNEN